MDLKPKIYANIHKNHEKNSLESHNLKKKGNFVSNHRKKLKKE